MFDKARRIALTLAGATIVFCAAAPMMVAPTWAQQHGADEAGEAPKQVALTQKKIDDLLAAQADIAAAQPSAPPKDEQTNEQPDPKMQARMDAAVKKHGFSGLDDYQGVFDSIGIVLAGIDPDTKTYVGPAAVIKKQIAQVQADKSLKPKEKAQALSDLKEALGAAGMAQPLPGNAEVVVKNYDKLSGAFQGAE